MGFKKARLKAGLTQQEAAEKLGVLRSTVSMWEIGASYPRSSALKEIASIYKCGVESLLEVDEHEEQLN